MKTQHFAALICGLNLTLMASVCYAQNGSAELWDRIAARDQRFSKFSAQWQMTYTQLPNPNGKSPFSSAPAPDDIPTDAFEQLSPDQKRWMEKRKQEIARAEDQWKSGFTVLQDINSTHFNGKTRTELQSSTSDHEAHVIEYFDGKHFASFEELQVAPFSPAKEQKTEWTGIVIPRPDEIFEMTMPDEISLLLAQQPITTFFNRQNTEVLTQNDTITLRRQAPQDKFPEAFVEITLTKNELAPIQFAEYPSRQSEAATLLKAEMQSLNGELIPKKVYSAESQRNSTVVYDLKQALIGEAVDEASVLIPSGIVVSDYRFGEADGVNYTIQDGRLLSDDQVKKLLGQRIPVKVAGLAKQEQSTNRIIWGVLLGVGLVVLGSVTWKKNA